MLSLLQHNGINKKKKVSFIIETTNQAINK